MMLPGKILIGSNDESSRNYLLSPNETPTRESGISRSKVLKFG